MGVVGLLRRVSPLGMRFEDGSAVVSGKYGRFKVREGKDTVEVVIVLDKGKVRKMFVDRAERSANEALASFVVNLMNAVAPAIGNANNEKK